MGEGGGVLTHCYWLVIGGGGQWGGDTFHHSEFQRKNAPPLGLILQKIHNVAGEFLGGKHGATQQPGLKEGQLHGNTG